MPPQDYPGYSAWEQYHQPVQSPAQAWSEAGTDEWERRRQYTVDSPHGQEDPTLHSLNERIGQLQIQTGNIEATLGDFVQSTAQWQQQYGRDSILLKRISAYSRSSRGPSGGPRDITLGHELSNSLGERPQEVSALHI